MNAQQHGFWAGVLLGGAGVGAVVGLVPLFFGVRQDRTWLAVGGFLACVAGGLAAGIIGAAILAGVFVLIIGPWREAATPAGQTQSRSMRGRSALGWYLVVMFFGQTIFLAAFWSFFMSFWLGKSFVSILLPAGASFGLIMGIFITALLAVMLRAGSVQVRVLDSGDFLDLLDRAATKLRLRLIERNNRTSLYEPKALLRTEATRICVEVGADQAVLTGPRVTVQRLKTEIEKLRAPK